jgi:hypothetical protein
MMAKILKEGDLSRKERARRIRREAYMRAKEQRATDPRYLAMKDAAKLRRREAYEAAKDRAKAAAVARKQAQKEQDDADRGARRVVADEKLSSRVRLASKPQ